VVVVMVSCGLLWMKEWRCWELLSFWVCRVSVALRAHLVCLARRPVVVVVVMVVVVGELG